MFKHGDGGYLKHGELLIGLAAGIHGGVGGVGKGWQIG